MENKNKKNQQLLKKIDRYRQKNSYTGKLLLGQYLKKLYDVTNDIKHLDEAIEAYSNAIKLDEEVEGYCERANLYLLKNENDSAFADFKKACKIYVPTGNFCEDLNITNHLKEMSQSISIKDSIAKLKEEGKLDPEFLKFYESLNDHYVKFSNKYVFKPKYENYNEQIKEINSQIKKLLEQNKQNSENNQEIEELKKDIEIILKKSAELNEKVDILKGAKIHLI